jgi:valyl-tRNA synthetase
VLDTWFSSALWTFSTLGWPEKTKDLETFHPTSFMSPAYEILPLWVSRMILMSAFHLGQIPFKTVLIHGLVRAKDGRKFSKSLNNGVDPLDMIQKYGADALRMGLLTGTAIGSDVKFDENKIKGYKHFANKIWNASRFVIENTVTGSDFPKEITNEEDKKTLEEFVKTKEDITLDMENYRFYLAAEKIYHYFWHTFADKILEECKLRIKEGKDTDSAKALLFKLLESQLKVLHPFMPFVTEKIWGLLPGRKDMLIIEKW